MAKEKTTSDKLKQVFAQAGGSEKDWKRVGKSKNDENEVVRIFENSKDRTQKIEVTEKANGAFTMKKVEAPVPEAGSEKAVEKVLNMIRDGDYDVAAADMKAAGTALLQRLVFAICPEDYDYQDQPPVAHIRFDAKSKMEDVDMASPVVQYFFPEAKFISLCGNDALYRFAKLQREDNRETALNIAVHLTAKGLTWDKKQQQYFDSSYEDAKYEPVMKSFTKGAQPAAKAKKTNGLK